jgi:hypothetical protein
MTGLRSARNALSRYPRVSARSKLIAFAVHVPVGFRMRLAGFAHESNVSNSWRTIEAREVW